MCARPVEIKLNLKPTVPFDNIANDATITPQKKYSSLAQIFSAKIVKALESGQTLPFLSSWKPGVGIDMPFNPLSGTVYRGINRLMLSFYLENRNLQDPRFMTERQAANKHWRIKPQNEAQWVVHWQWTFKKPLLDPNGKKMRDEDGKVMFTEYRLSQPRATYKRVYHASSVETADGTPIPEFIPPPCTWDVNTRILAIQNNMDLPVEHITGDKASYRLNADRILLPFRSYFRNEGEYNSTFLHEAIHSTGHHDRLKRHNLENNKDYIVEELVAEIGAWMLCQQLQVPHYPKNNLAYIQGYSKQIQNDPFVIMRASRDAEVASRYILENWDDPMFRLQSNAKEIPDEDEFGDMLDAFDGLGEVSGLDVLPPPAQSLPTESESPMFF